MLEAEFIETTQHEDGSATYKRPFYAEVLSPRSEQVALLQELGYRFVKKDIPWDRAFYARPWPLWAVLRLNRKVRDAFMAMAGWLYHRGVFHFRTPENLCVRWRDLGLGPGPSRGRRC